MALGILKGSSEPFSEDSCLHDSRIQVEVYLVLLAGSKKIHQ
jgi:hypothetical protein